MATLADLQQRRDSLFKALTDGIRSFRDQNGEEVAFSSGSEMRPPWRLWTGKSRT